MIKYDARERGVMFVVRWKGSVFPKAFLWAAPNAILAVLLHIYARHDAEAEHPAGVNMGGVNILWAGYTSVLGFLMVFRNNQAYTRFWEGATLINQVRGEWFNAVSSLFAFCSKSKEVTKEVQAFQNILIRLFSMLYCSALQQVCDLDDDTLEIIENSGMDHASLKFLHESNDRCEVLVQWIQRLIVDSQEQKVINIAPPLLTRAFQELSRGIVNLNNARKIKEIPFPFPYAQMITCMMIVHWVATPLIACQVIESAYAAGVVCFFVTLSFWCLIYIALELDQPFGDDDNDLPVREIQRDFNQSLLNLLDPLAQTVPIYHVSGGAWLATVSKSNVTLTTLCDKHQHKEDSDSCKGSESASPSRPDLPLGASPDDRRWLEVLKRPETPPLSGPPAVPPNGQEILDSLEAITVTVEPEQAAEGTSPAPGEGLGPKGSKTEEGAGAATNGPAHRGQRKPPGPVRTATEQPPAGAAPAGSSSRRPNPARTVPTGQVTRAEACCGLQVMWQASQQGGSYRG